MDVCVVAGDHRRGISKASPVARTSPPEISMSSEKFLSLLQSGNVDEFNASRPAHLDFFAADLSNAQMMNADLNNVNLEKADLSNGAQKSKEEAGYVNYNAFRKYWRKHSITARSQERFPHYWRKHSCEPWE